MGIPKKRITVTVDAAWVDAVQAKVEAGDAESLSAWVADAMAAKARQESLNEAARRAIADYEAEFGKITDEELEEQRRLDDERREWVNDRPRKARRSA